MLQIAPGTVARSYSELERLKVVKTEGARGTRISFELGSADVDGSHTERLSAAFRPIVVAAFTREPAQPNYAQPSMKPCAEFTQ